MAGPEVLLTLTGFDKFGHQITGPAMVKTSGGHTLSRVRAAFCRWICVSPDLVDLVDLKPELTVEQAGLRSGNAVNAMLAAGATPSPASQASPFTMLDVVDSELGAAAESAMEL
jgi:hypothetical protein